MKKVTSAALFALYVVATSWVLMIVWNLFAADIFRVEISHVDALGLRLVMSLFAGDVSFSNVRERMLSELVSSVAVLGFALLLKVAV